MAAPTSLLPIVFHHYQYQNQNPSYFINMHVPILSTADHQELPSHDSRSSIFRDSAIFASTIAGFLGLLQVQAAGNSFSSSEQHRIISIAFVLSLLGYFLASRAKFRFPGYASQIDILMAVLANSSVASSVSLFLPNSKSLWPGIFIFHLVLLTEPLYPTTIKILFDKYVLPLFCRRPAPPLLPLTAINPAYSAATTVATPYRNVTASATVVGPSLPVTFGFGVQSIATLGGGALNNGAPYQIVTEQATIFESSSPFAYRRAQPQPDQIINSPATIFGSSPPFIRRRAQPMPRAELSSPNEA